ncbi:MAG: hypothetical protein JSV18_01280 [Candidatus Bathyarchaeota archaeon]|nr:MAG: hypothetical protein JSV18_01280 [Candidatus Bathyarchaeota archaeon]
MVFHEDRDREMLAEMPKERLLALFALHIRNIWRVDGLYFLGIEKRFGTEAATEIDAACWRVMGKLEARLLRDVLGVGGVDPASFIHLLRNTSWALDVLGKENEVIGDSAIFRVVDCGTQNTRIRKDLGVFPCKQVRHGYLEAFARELDPNIEMTCRVCPPDERPPDVWCEWEFRFRNSTD